FERGQNVRAALIRDAATNLRQLAQIGVKKARQVSQTDCPRNAHPDLLARAGEFFAQRPQRLLDVPQKLRGFSKEKLPGGRRSNTARSALQQFEAEAVLHSLHLPCDG